MTTNKNYLTVKEVADLLKICPTKAYEIFNQQDFPSIRIGRSLRVEENDLFDWFKNHSSID